MASGAAIRESAMSRFAFALVSARVRVTRLPPCPPARLLRTMFMRCQKFALGLPLPWSWGVKDRCPLLQTNTTDTIWPRLSSSTTTYTTVKVFPRSQRDHAGAPSCLSKSSCTALGAELGVTFFWAAGQSRSCLTSPHQFEVARSTYKKFYRKRASYWKIYC